MPRTRKTAPAGEGADPVAQEKAAEEVTPAVPRSRKRSPVPTGPALEEEARQAEVLRLQLCDLSAQVEGFGRQMREARAEVEGLRQHRDQSAVELEELRRQARAVQQQVLQESLAALERIRREAVATEQQATEIAQLFQQARAFLQTLPRQADAVQQRLAEVERRLPDAERELQRVEHSSETVQLELEAAELEALEARQRLDALLMETAATELRLAGVRQEFREAEKRLRDIQESLEEAEREALEAELQAQEVRQEAVEAAPVVASAAPPEGRNRLGVTVSPCVVVAEVLPDTPASAAGLVPGDVINSVNGTEVKTGVELRDRIHSDDGEEVTLQVTRAGGATEVKGRLHRLPGGEESARGRNRLGLTVEPGVVVAEVLPGTPAELAGLARGDVINTVNGTPVVTSEQLRQAVLHLTAHAEVTLQVRRGGEVREVRTHLDEAATPASLGQES